MLYVSVYSTHMLHTFFPNRIKLWTLFCDEVEGDTEFVQDVEVSAQRQRKLLKYPHKERLVTGRHWHACTMDYTTFTIILLSRLLNVMGYIPQWIALKIESKLFAEALQP